MAVPDLYVSFTSLHTADSAQVAGPPLDPQLRYSEVWKCSPSDVVTFIRQNDYTCQVSRAFLHDDEYYSVNYYQSGSGNTLTSDAITVEFTAGDYMIGAKEQKIAVQAGDFTYGSPQTFDTPSTSQDIFTSVAVGASNIVNTDTVATARASAFGFPLTGVFEGDPFVANWTFASLAGASSQTAGGRLVVAGSTGVAGANGTWTIITTTGVGTAVSYITPITQTNGDALLGTGTFGNTANGVSITSMTGYQFFNFDQVYDAATAALLIGGTMTVSASATGANNGVKTIARIDPVTTSGTARVNRIWIVTGSEATDGSSFTAVLSTGNDDQWVFSGNNFDDALLIGPHTLVVEGSSFTLAGRTINNDSAPDYSILDVPGVHTIETDGASITPEYFKVPFPTVTIHVPDDVTPYTFFLQDLDVSYALKGALLIVTSDTFDPTNNAVYEITDVDPDPSHHIVYAKPTDGRTDYRSQMFYPDDQGIQVVQRTNVSPEFQPCWLMVPLTGTKPVVGHWEYMIAYADWRFEGDDPPNLFTLSVSSPVRTADAWTVMLPYRAISFTVGQSVVTTSGQVVNAAIASNASTVGLKQFTLSDTPGLASVASGEMLLPGPMCGEFTASGFHENGVNFGFEAPFLVSQQVSDNGVGLRVGGVYQYVAVAEVTDEDGDRVFSIVSPPLNFQMNGANNSATIGGRMLQPLDSNGAAVDKHFGVTNYRLLGISIYRTAYQDNVVTTERHKITLDLNVNGLAPVSTTNASGFSFPDEFTWNYIDENLDAAILPAEVVYIDKGYLPRFPAPAQRCGVFWKDRSWVIGYDGAVWMSGEKKEGDATWFFPLFRFVLPTTDQPVSIAEMDDYLLIQCERSHWYIPAATFPDATGKGGVLPAPIQLPFTNGGTGHAVTLHAGVAYSSTANGVWLITRSLENKWLSQQIQDKLSDLPITGMAVDKRQRLHVTTLGSLWFVYDQVVQNWSWWNLPTSGAHFPTTLDGEVAFEDSSHVWLYNPSVFADDLAGTPVGIPLDITLSSLNFSNVRGLKAVWEMQLVGTYKGEHNLNAILSYPDDDPDNPTVFPDPADGPYTPDPASPYLLAINPMIEQASSFGLRIFADFDGIDDPGDSFELELVSCEVGIDSTVGLNKFVDTRRIPGA